MIFNKGDKIIFDGHKRECVCCDEDTAIFATFTSHYHKPEGKNEFEKDDNVICYDNMFAVSNLDEHRDLIDFEFVGGDINGQIRRFNTRSR